MRATAQVCFAIGEDQSGQGQKVQQAGTELQNQHARVLLIAGPDLRAPLTTFTQAMASDATAVCDPYENYVELQDAFVAGAQPDLK